MTSKLAPTDGKGDAPLLFRSVRLGGLALLLAVTLVALSARDNASAQAPSPGLLLPWQHGNAWITGALGYHGTNDAIDFFPPDAPFGGALQCEGQPGWDFEESSHWMLASAPGTVEQVAHAYVLIYHGNGWFTRYWHLSAPQVHVGQQVVAGQRLGHPSTYGECATGPHVHYWASGPNGQTTRNVTLSGRPASEIARPNQWLSNTYNVEPGSTPVPTPSPTPTPVPTPVPTPTPSPSPSPTPSPTLWQPPSELPTFPPSPTALPEIVRGDVNCDGVINNTDAVMVLRYIAGIEDSKCLTATAEINCDGVVTVADAIALLKDNAGMSRQPAAECPTLAPRPTDEGSTPTPTPDPPTETATPGT